jgi:hypothetical protein
MTHNLTEHFFYKQKNIGIEKKLKNAEENMNTELYKTFYAEVSKVLETWFSLYKVVLQSPDAFNELNQQCDNDKKGFERLEENVRLGCADELKCKYVEANKFIKYADNLYTKESRFSTRIGLLAASIAVFVDKAIEKKIQIKEINSEWRKANYFFYNDLDSADFKAPQLKRLKKDEQSEAMDLSEEKKSVSWEFPH